MPEDKHVQQLLSVAVAVGVVAATGGVAYWLYKRSTTKKKFLQDPDVKYSVPLVHKEPVSRDTRLFRFGLPDKKTVLGLPIDMGALVSREVKMLAVVNRPALMARPAVYNAVATGTLQLYKQAAANQCPVLDRWLRWGQMKVVVKAPDGDELRRLHCLLDELPDTQVVLLTNKHACMRQTCDIIRNHNKPKKTAPKKKKPASDAQPTTAGQHIYVTANIDGKPVVRPYTPTSSDWDLGYMDLVVKVYAANVHPKFPQGGKMSQHLDHLNIGDTIDIRGPNGLLVYKTHGEFDIRPKKNAPSERVKVKKVGMLCGGTGITPMYQLIKYICLHEADETEIALIFANQTETDILLRDRLERFAVQHPKQFKLWFTLDKPPEGWTQGSGFINADMVGAHLPAPGPDTLILMCGPPPMLDFACKPALQQLGYDQKLIFAY